jgi:hypothetical protein
VQKAYALLASQNGRSQIPMSRLLWRRSVAFSGRSKAPCWRFATFEVSPVQEYRAYTVGPDGHFIGYEPLVCGSDKEAIEKAKQFVDCHDVELSSGARLVIRLSHKT